MSADDVLPLILAAADDEGRVFDYSETLSWPPGALDQLRKIGLLREAQTGFMAPCPNCDDGHIEPVHTIDGRYFIHCGQSLRVEVTADMCRGWEVDTAVLARLVAVALGMKPKVREVVPGRFWSLGRVKWNGTTREVVLATRMIDRDGEIVAHHVGPGGKPIVLVPHYVPDARVWSGRQPAVVALSHIAEITGVGLQVDVVAMFEAVQAADAVAHTIGGLTLTEKELRVVIRRTNKDTQRTELTDAALAKAAELAGSARKAATALKAQGYGVHHSTISRAIDREGGKAALVRETDSASISRRVASQRRDRATKNDQYGNCLPNQ